MRHFNLAYIFVLFLTLPFLNSCDQAPNKNRIIGNIVAEMEAQKQQYFDVNFKIVAVQNNELVYDLSASASLKTGKYGHISQAYFNIDGDDKLHYLHTISDLQSPIFLLESTELDQNKAANVHDSINSPVKLHPSLLREWLQSAHHTELTNDHDQGIIDVSLQLATKAIKLSWNINERRIDSLEVWEANAYTYKWNFNYLTEAAFKVEEKAKRRALGNQNQEFL